MVIDPDKLVENLKKKKKKRRGPVTLYLDQELMEAFKKHCSPVAPSRVIEEFIRQCLNTSKKK